MSVNPRTVRTIVAQDIRSGLAGSTGKMQWVLASDLQIDQSYQRVGPQISRAAINRIARSFDPDIFHVLKVSLRVDKNLYVIDGQHRLLAIREMGWNDQLLPCMVHQGLTIADEAHIFSESQRTQRRLSPQAILKADVIARKPDAMAIVEIVAESGFLINYESGERSGRHICSVAALRKIVTTHAAGNELLARTLAVIARSWGTELGPRSSVLLGLAEFLRRYGDRVDQNRLVRVLERLNPERMISDGRLQASLNGIKTEEGVGRHILTVYNKKVHVANRMEGWESAGRLAAQASRARGLRTLRERVRGQQ